MKRTFIIGDEWLYYKIYCGNRTCDTILTDVFKPLAESLLKEKIIDKWFFIRYADPQNHLRVRFHCPDISKLCHVIEKFKETIEFYVESDLIWNIQIETYQRELERYGKNNIIESEELFYIDSEACVNALNLINDDDVLFLFALKSIDSLLSTFEYNIEEKKSFTKINKETFRKEFSADKKLTKQLNVKYQLLRNELEHLMSTNLNDIYAPLVDILSVKENMMKPLTTKINTLNHKLLSSYIHMMVNRFFRDKQRLHELVCYDFLNRYYNTINAKNKIKNLEA